MYWNSRLATEHSRLINIIAKSASSNFTTSASSATTATAATAAASTLTSSVAIRPVRIVADMMAGVGPFAVPLGMKRSVAIYANGMALYVN